MVPSSAAVSSGWSLYCPLRLASECDWVLVRLVVGGAVDWQLCPWQSAVVFYLQLCGWQIGAPGKKIPFKIKLVVVVLVVVRLGGWVLDSVSLTIFTETAGWKKSIWNQIQSEQNWAEPPCGCELCLSLKRSELMRPNVITSQSGRGKSMLFHMFGFFFFISSSFDPAVIPQIDLLQAEACLGMELLTRTDVVRGGKQAVEAQISCQKLCVHEAPPDRCVVVSLENAETALWWETTVTVSGKSFCSPTVRKLAKGLTVVGRG